MKCYQNVIKLKEKKLIIERFKKNLKNYNIEAIVQKNMASEMIENLIKLKGNEYNKILEFGCGTGFLTKQIVENILYSEFYVNDIVEECKKYIDSLNKAIIFLSGDIEIINIPSYFDLIISNAVFQWLKYPENFFKKIFLSLNKNGIFCFSTFGKDNFLELKNLNLPYLEYRSSEKINEIASKYFNLLSFYEQKVYLYFASPIDVLKHIKKTGTNGITTFKFTKATLDKFIIEYLTLFNTEKGVSLTYNPMFFYFQRR